MRAKQLRFILVIVMPLSVSPQQSDDHSCDSSKYKHQDENPKRKRTTRLNIDQVLQRIHRQRITDRPVASFSQEHGRLFARELDTIRHGSVAMTSANYNTDTF